MKCVRNIIAVLLTSIFILTLLPITALAESAQPYEKIEHPEPGVTAYYNKDGTITYDIELTQAADRAVMPLAATEPEKDTLTDAGAYLVGMDDEVRVQIKKEFQEGETLVTVGANGTSVSFYPVIQDLAVEQPITSETVPDTAQKQPDLEVPEGVRPDASQEIKDGIIISFVEYTEKAERKPLEVLRVPAETERAELALPQTVNVLLDGVEQPYALPVKHWMEFEGTSGDELGQWRFQPEWDLNAFPLSESLQSAIAGDPEDMEDDDPFVVPYILVTWEESAEEQSEATASPQPSDTPESDSTTSPASDTSETPQPETSAAVKNTPEQSSENAASPASEQEPVSSAKPTVKTIPAGSITPESEPSTEAIAEQTTQRRNGDFNVTRLSFVRREEVPPEAVPPFSTEPGTELADPEPPALQPSTAPQTPAPEEAISAPTPAPAESAASASPTLPQDGEASAPEENISSTSAEAPAVTPDAEFSPQPEEREPVSATGRRRGQGAVVYEDVFEEGTDIRLSAMTTGVKEDIVIGSYTGNHVYAYRMNFHGLTPVQSGGEIQLFHMNQQRGVVHAPYMVDANGNRSADIAVAFHSAGNEYELTYTPSDSWLSAAERAYPVTIDPWLDYWNGSPDGSAGSAYGTYVNTATPDSNYGTSGALYAGGTSTTLVQPVFSSAITAYANRMLIQASYLKASILSGNPSTTNMYPILSSWGTGTVTANTMPTLGAGENAGWTSSLSAWNVTPIVSSWFNAISQRSNNGLALANPDGEAVKMSNSFVLSLTVYRVDEARSLSATTVDNGDGTGSVNLSWTAIGEATGYYTRAKKLTPRMLNELIEKIEVHQAQKVDGVYVQRLTIHYNCIGSLAIPDIPSLPPPEVTVQTRKGVAVSYAAMQEAV